MYPILFRIPPFGPLTQPFVITTYAVFIALGFVLCTWLIAQEAKRQGENNTQRFTDLAFYLLIVGIVGSRLLYIAINWRSLDHSPFAMITLWRGGLVFYGGFIAATLFALGWAKRQRIPFLRLADMMIPMVALNHVFGRIGCIFAGCCYGSPTNLPWALHYPLDSVVQANQHAAHLVALGDLPLPVHPAPLYEAAGELVLFAVLMWYRKRKVYDGQLLLVWLMAYPVLRSLVEVFRGDTERGFVIPGMVSTSQFISLFVAAIAVWLFAAVRQRNLRPQS